MYHTNHPIVNDDVKPWFAEFNPKEIADTIPVTSNSYSRLAALTTRITNTDAVYDDLIKDALRSKDDANNPVCRSLDPKKNGFSFASVVMTLNRRAISSDYSRSPFGKGEYEGCFFQLE